MKNPLLASLLATFGCAALAQSSVTIFGVLDSTVQRASQGGASITRLNGNGGNQFSRFGLRGVEDLGGGTSVGFVLDAGLSIDTGTGGATSADNVTAQAASGLVFNRRSTVSAISQDWGEVRLGRDFVPTYWNLTIFDPFGTAGSASVNNLAQGALTRSSTIQTAVRASNTIGYFLPALGGFHGQAMYALTGGGVPGVANAAWTGLDLGIRHSF
jgi:predicted porin